MDLESRFLSYDNDTTGPVHIARDRGGTPVVRESRGPIGSPVLELASKG